MLDKVVCEKCGSGNKCVHVQCKCNAALPLPLPLPAARSSVNATATASPVNLSRGNAAVGDGRERTKAEARLLPDWALREKAQRTQEALAAGISARLPDGGRRLRLWLDASLGETSNRRRDAPAAPHPHGGNGEAAPVPDAVVCEICGSGSWANLIAQCARCNAYEHRYCMQVVAYSIPHEWYCYESQEKDNGDPKRSRASVPLNDPHMEEFEVETDPTQLQSVLPAEVPMEMWEQSPMSDGDNANVLLEDPQVEAAEAEEECHVNFCRKCYVRLSDAGREKQQSSFNLDGKQKYCDGHTILKANKDEEYKVANIIAHTVTDFSTMMNQAVSNLMQEFRRWRPRITEYHKGHQTVKVNKTAARARGR